MALLLTFSHVNSTNEIGSTQTKTETSSTSDCCFDRFQPVSLLGEPNERERQLHGIEHRTEQENNELLLYSIAVVLCVLYLSRQH